MSQREEFLHILADGLVSTEYSDRFLQEMSDHLDDAEQLYALKENGNESEQNALRDMGDPKHSQKLFNHVMKYRHTISVLIECLLLAALAVPVSYVADTLGWYVQFAGAGVGYAVLTLLAQITVVTLFMVFALRRIQAITFGEVKLIYPALAFLVGFSCTLVFTWLFANGMSVDAPTLQQVYNDILATGSARLIGCIVGYFLVIKSPWNRTGAWKKWQDYRATHSLTLGPVGKIVYGSTLSMYLIISTVLLWIGIDSHSNQRVALALFQAPRQFVEQIVSFFVLKLLDFLGSRTEIIVLAGVLFAFAAFLTVMIVKAYQSKASISSVQCAAVVYIACILFFTPQLPPEPAKNIQWQVPVEDIERAQLHKQFSVLDRFASYVNSFHEPVAYAVRYRPTSHEFNIATDHPHQVLSITAIQNVHTYINVPAENQKRFAGYAEEKTFPKGFSCDIIASNALTASPSDGSYCGTVYYQQKKLFVVPQGRFVYVDHIVVDETGTFALILMRNDVERMVNNQVYLVELPKTE